MAARIPIKFLTNELKSCITKDLHLVETEKGFFSKQNKYQKEEKSIDFFITDKISNDILLPYYYACQLLKVPHINRRKVFPKVPPWTFNPGFSLRDYQIEVLNLTKGMYQTNGAAFFNVFCSFGKTVVTTYKAYEFVQSHGLLTLVTHPGTVLKKSWAGTFSNLTTARIHIVDLGAGYEEISDEVQVIICADSRLHRIHPNILAKVGHFVIDEADRFCTQGHVNGLLSIEPLVITLLTATYERDDGMEKMLDLIAGPDRITRISTKPFYVLHCPTPFCPEEVKVTSRGIQYDSLVAELDKIDARNLFICNLVIMNIKEKILILTYHVEHAVYLYLCLKEMITPYGRTIAIFADKLKEYVDSDILIGTRSKIGIGFDEKDVAIGWYRPIEQGGQRRFNYLILASIGKKIEQIAGRVFRADVPVIVDIVDSHENTRKHYAKRKPWYESRNGIIKTASTLEDCVWDNIKDNFTASPNVSTSVGQSHIKKLMTRLKG